MTRLRYKLINWYVFLDIWETYTSEMNLVKYFIVKLLQNEFFSLN